MSAIRRDHKQTNINMGKKLSNFLDIKQKYRKIRKYKKGKQRLWLLSGETTLPRLSLLLTITSTRVVRQSSNWEFGYFSIRAQSNIKSTKGINTITNTRAIHHKQQIIIESTLVSACSIQYNTRTSTKTASSRSFGAWLFPDFLGWENVATMFGGT